MRHGALRSLRQALKWQWIERNIAADVPNPVHARKEFTPFDTWDEVEAVAAEPGPFGPVAIFQRRHRRAAQGSLRRRVDRGRHGGRRIN
jgi:hypothetical protein